ncbi:DUF6954 family protein [Sedimentibacter saalensis]|uniref:DUF6954 family protein n=1 Tax=Sedimentibacter saalensis TaxID=130788 RepID=UPI00289D8BB9|nr:hypothetical protein [Sedimentibacter saalensis]
MKENFKSNLIGSLITVALGTLLGFFGVAVSVFSDGLVFERLVTILIVLIIYGIVSIVLGFLKPTYTWLYMLSLSMPGVIILALYSSREFNILYVAYIILILAFSFFGTKTGKSMKRKKK